MASNKRIAFAFTPGVVPLERALTLPATKRSIQVAPLHRPSRVTLTALQLDAHPVFLHFVDRGVEQKFQTFFRQEKQAWLPMYMLSILVLAIIVCGSVVSKNAGVIEEFLPWIVTVSGGPTGSSTSITTVETSALLAVTITFYAIAGAIIGFVWYRNSDLNFGRVRLDTMQLTLLAFCHLVLTPVFVAIGAILAAHLSLGKLLGPSAVARSVVNAIGEGQVSALVFFELIIVICCGLLLHLQFWYFCVLFVECVVLVCVLTAEQLSPDVGARVASFFFLCGILCLVLWTTYDNERTWRGQFVSSCNLITENRRLSNQNIEMKEELSSTKANPQLHYEMGDILRVLCQLKVKMSQTEKRDVDRIITALVTKQDLYEVRIDPAMTEYEEEVQGWLHMMASKQAIPKRLSRASSSRQLSGSFGRRISAPTEVLPVASSRRFSQNACVEDQACVSEAISKLLEAQVDNKHDRMSQWLFDKIRNEFFVDIFYIEEHCGAPLQLVFVACVELNECVRVLSLDITKVSEFAAAVESHYFKKNPYHNALHAAAVVADINFYLRRVNLEIDDTTFFVALVAAAAHDISHPGVTNGFLIATKSKLAITYSDDSVLERMHVAELYRILSLEKFDIFSHMATSVKADIRKMIIGMVLATDLARHFPRISKLKSKQFGVSAEDRGVQVSLIMETLLMLADLGHTAKPFDYHQKWASRISEEFYLQGDAEERRKLPVSPLCDRRQANLPKSQVTFLTVIATPLFEAAGQALSIDEYSVVLGELRNNITVWQGRIESDVNASHDRNGASHGPAVEESSR